MSTIAPKPDLATNAWILALIVSVALNGLVIGLLVSGSIGKKKNRDIKTPIQSFMQANPNDARGFVQHLEPQRRREVLEKALQKTRTKWPKSERPRQLIKTLRDHRVRLARLIAQEKFDMQAVEQTLKDMRNIKNKLARQGDAIILWTMRELTFEERKPIPGHMNTTRRQRQMQK